MLRKGAVGRHKLYLMSMCAWCTRSFVIRTAACGQKLCLLGSENFQKQKNICLGRPCNNGVCGVVCSLPIWM